MIRTCSIKKMVVEKDPTEQGERAYLNFGHTLGHAVEKLKDFPCSTVIVWGWDAWRLPGSAV